MYVFAIVCPPFATLIAGQPKQAVINLVLTLLGWVPGVVHAFIVIKEAKNRHDALHEYEQKRQDAKSH